MSCEPDYCKMVHAPSYCEMVRELDYCKMVHAAVCFEKGGRLAGAALGEQASHIESKQDQ